MSSIPYRGLTISFASFPRKTFLVSPTVSWLIWKPPVLYIGPNRAITRTKNHLTSSIPTEQPPPPLRVEDNTERFKPNGILGWKDIGPFLSFGCDGRRRRAHASASKLILVGSKETSEPSVYGLNGVFTRQYPHSKKSVVIGLMSHFDQRQRLRWVFP